MDNEHHWNDRENGIEDGICDGTKSQRSYQASFVPFPNGAISSKVVWDGLLGAKLQMWR